MSGALAFGGCERAHGDFCRPAEGDFTGAMMMTEVLTQLLG